MACTRRSGALKVCGAALTLALVATAHAAINVDYRQDANADSGFTVGDAHWINSVVQTGNAVYFEGMSLPQRIILDSLPGTNAAGTEHSISFHHQWTKSGTHAFDWLTSWTQAETAGTAELQTYYNGATVMDVIGFKNGIDLAASLLPVTVALTGGANHATVLVPDDGFTSANLGSSRAVQPLVNAYELAYGDRLIDLFTDKPLSGTPTLTLAHTDAQGNVIANNADTGDTYVTYKLSWTTTVKSTQAVVWMAAHIAVGNDAATLVNLAPGGWGVNKGASQINGGPYHFSLDLVDNKSVGSQDNQLKGSSIRALPVCTATGPVSLCPGDVATYTVPATIGFTYRWTLSNNSNNATIVGPTNGTSVQVQTGTGCGTGFTICVKVTDSTGLSNTCCIPVIVNDAEEPTITCPALGPYQCADAVPAAYTSLSSFLAAGGTASDNCDTSLAFSLSGSTALPNACGGSLTRTYRVTDDCGNYAECTQTIVVSDTTKPTAGNPAPVTVQCKDLVPTPDPAVVTDEADNCGTPTVTFVSDSSDGKTCPETITRTYKVADACGNSINVTQTITVNDTTKPTAGNPSPITVQCKALVPAPDVAVVTDEADNCGTPTVAFVDDVSDGKTCPETITRTYKVTDACGNSIAVTQTITISDTTNPTASNPEPVAVQCKDLVPAPNVAVVTDEADNCGTPTVTYVGDESDGGACPETITRIYKVTDACGNSINVTQTITVHDTLRPVLSGQGPDGTIECPAAPSFTAPTATDNCDANPEITYVDTPVDGTTCATDHIVRIVTRTWTATDACGNKSDTVSQTITVKDTTAPDITGVGPDTTIDCKSPLQFSTPTALDVCGTAMLNSEDVTTPGACAGSYSVTRTWTATDECGNTSQASQTITVQDTTAPEAACATTATVTIPAPTATDDCSGPPTISFSRSDGLGAADPYPVGTPVTVTFTIKDGCGNTSACSYVVSVAKQ